MFTAIITINAIIFIMGICIILIMAIVTVILIIVINNKVNTMIINHTMIIYLLRRDPECYCPKVDLLVSLNAGEDKENACIFIFLFFIHPKNSICIKLFLDPLSGAHSKENQNFYAIIIVIIDHHHHHLY